MSWQSVPLLAQRDWHTFIFYFVNKRKDVGMELKVVGVRAKGGGGEEKKKNCHADTERAV